MARPKTRRRVQTQPLVGLFIPWGADPGRLKGVTLSIDGWEALRLVDAQGLDQAAAAATMGISRPTLSRLLAEARCATAKALANGWAIRIEGGQVVIGPAESAKAADIPNLGPDSFPDGEGKALTESGSSNLF